MPRQYKPMPRRPAPPHATWVVAADAGRARIFTVGPDDGRLTELADLINPEARLQDHDSLSDRRGEVMQGPTHVGHGLEPRQWHDEHVAQAFARDLARRLNKAQVSGEVAHLYLVAEPRFLGLLRPELEPATQAAVSKELASDYTRHPADAIRSLLPAQL